MKQPSPGLADLTLDELSDLSRMARHTAAVEESAATENFYADIFRARAAKYKALACKLDAEAQVRRSYTPPAPVPAAEVTVASSTGVDESENTMEWDGVQYTAVAGFSCIGCAFAATGYCPSPSQFISSSGCSPADRKDNRAIIWVRHEPAAEVATTPTPVAEVTVSPTPVDESENTMEWEGVQYKAVKAPNCINCAFASTDYCPSLPQFNKTPGCTPPLREDNLYINWVRHEPAAEVTVASPTPVDESENTMEWEGVQYRAIERQGCGDCAFALTHCPTLPEFINTSGCSPASRKDNRPINWVPAPQCAPEDLLSFFEVVYMELHRLELVPASSVANIYPDRMEWGHGGLTHSQMEQVVALLNHLLSLYPPVRGAMESTYVFDRHFILVHLAMPHDIVAATYQGEA